VSALTGGGGGGSRPSSKPGRPDESAATAENCCCSCDAKDGGGGGCDVNSNCEQLARRKGEEGMAMADRPEPEGINETDGPTGIKSIPLRYRIINHLGSNVPVLQFRNHPCFRDQFCTGTVIARSRAYYCHTLRYRYFLNCF
jgi:hypothetical protein